METVTISPNGDRIEFVPVKPAHEFRGILRSLDTTFERDREDRA